MKNSIFSRLVYNAKILPLTKLTPPVLPSFGSFDGGVYYQDNTICQEGLHAKTHYRNVPKNIDFSSFEKINGCHFFGGMLQEHFGHFLTESIGRLWVKNYIAKKIDSIIYYHRVPSGKIPNFVHEFFELLGIECRVEIIRNPVVVDEILVPQQVEKNGMLYGHSVMKELVSPLKLIDGGGSKKIYVSRARLNLNDGGFFCEDLIEKYLLDDGYHVIYPEKMTIQQQLAAYNSAEKIIFAEGSALHLYALVARPEQHVFVVWRRKVATHFEWQINTFGGPKKIHGVPCIKETYMPPAGEVCARAVIDFERLSEELYEKNFISLKKWDSLSDGLIGEFLENLIKNTKKDYLKIHVKN